MKSIHHMDEELRQHLETAERSINAHVDDSLAQFETNVVAALIDLRDTLTRGLDNGFERMNRRFDEVEARFDAVDARLDAQDRILDREDVLIDEYVRVMNEDIERMDKLLASRPS